MCNQFLRDNVLGVCSPTLFAIFVTVTSAYVSTSPSNEGEADLGTRRGNFQQVVRASHEYYAKRSARCGGRKRNNVREGNTNSRVMACHDQTVLVAVGEDDDVAGLQEA